MQTTGRGVALAIVVAVAVGFLAGYVPSCRRAGDLQARLDRAEQFADFATARDLGSLLHVELANRNFGNAAGAATRFFDHVRALSEQPSNPQTQEGLKQILAQREAISSGLAKNDPGIEPQIRAILQQLHMLGPSPAGGS